jgi:lysophospholipase L1-like esterase
LYDVAGWGVVAGAAVVGGLVAEAVWTVRRPLPSLTGWDASGTIPGRDDADPLTVVALGDSTLTGPGLGDPSQVWLRQALERLAIPRPVELRSLAEGGSRVADVAQRIDAARAVGPDLVVIAVGSNDALRGTSTRTIRRQLDTLLGHLLDGVPIAAVANVGDLGSIPRVPPPLRSILQRRSRSVRAAIEDVVASHGRTVLLDVTPADEALRDRRLFAPDLFHPGAGGHEAWAVAAMPGLRSAFDRLSTDDTAAAVQER